jgi:tetratricopeptide (TPR) repeat protein
MGKEYKNMNQPEKAPRTIKRGLALALSVVGMLTLVVLALTARGVFRQDGGVGDVVEPTSHPPAALTTARDYVALGDYQFDQAQYAEAIDSYTHAITLDRNLAAAYNNRAYTYMKLGNYALALPDLNQAIELRPDYTNALMNRGDIFNYYYQIDRTRAVADYDRVLAADPDAIQNTSVCGHRAVALNGGMDAVLWLKVVTSRNPRQTGCPSVEP